MVNIFSKIFSKRTKASPQLGQDVFWRGMRMTVTKVVEHKSTVLVEYANKYYTCTTKATDLVFHPETAVWGVRGCEGCLPKLVRGEIVDPELPKCDCGAVTWRRRSNDDESPLCGDCRLILEDSQESNMEGNS